ncbi:hypothetical protein SNOG_01178 [Parastagonospora nodorum SN15]|uniref:Uncharacterized protein n=1 Tax=Phaeosphaeria nodorum (strain SN15 / ATCC MYA-4574 / FGSC 10173) TaxID=321614 RepID=Q0V486_PHANO|nr:hypothetical protein SNOG_01178 [Parastagonospora nodorum SN15]EAT90827.2 hypothetical protein SNOG_01178 [Parastagonospora nodorum SN15]
MSLVFAANSPKSAWVSDWYRDWRPRCEGARRAERGRRWLLPRSSVRLNEFSSTVFALVRMEIARSTSSRMCGSESCAVSRRRVKSSETRTSMTVWKKRTRRTSMSTRRRTAWAKSST